MILIISFENNPHVDAVRRHLRVPYVVFDASWFPASVGLEARFANGIYGARLSLPNGTQIDLSDVCAVWNRRVRPMSLHPELRDDTSRLFAWSECNEALLGLWYALDCFWMNPPTADEVSQRKIRQLQLAQELGLRVPRTIVTNIPDLARQFIEEHGPGRVVRKAFRNLSQAPRETRIVEAEDLALIGSVRYAPVTFQEFIPVALDLRVTIVDTDIFAAAIRTEGQYCADYRLGLANAAVEPYELPSEIAERLMVLMKALNISYGAIDLRVTPEGEHVFFEVNPAGEYLFISERTGQPIPSAIASALERHHREAGG